MANVRAEVNHLVSTVVPDTHCLEQVANVGRDCVRDGEEVAALGAAFLPEEAWTHACVVTLRRFDIDFEIDAPNFH